MNKRKTTAMELDGNVGRVRVTKSMTWFSSGGKEHDVLDITTTRHDGENDNETHKQLDNVRTVKLTHDEVLFFDECARFQGIDS
jgi:hypothetical protein